MCVNVTNATRNAGRCCPGTIAIRKWIENKHPSFFYSGCYSYRRIRGSNNLSVHSEGRALDISVRNFNNVANNQAMWWAVNQLVANYCSLGIQRIIFDSRVWNANDGVVFGPGGWRTFSGRAGNHKDHAHIEIAREFCDTLNYEAVLNVFAGPPVSVPNPDAQPDDVQDDPATPPAIQVIQAPPPPPSLPLTDTSGQWTPENLTDACPGFSGVPDEDRFFAIICGGRGGYAINRATGEVCAAGLAQFHGDVTPGFVDFLPYGNGYYVIDAGGFTISNYGPDTSTERPNCPVLAGPPYTSLYSPRAGTLVAVGSDTAERPTLCRFAAPQIAGALYQGPCC